jgi:hypothetical protein
VLTVVPIVRVTQFIEVVLFSLLAVESSTVPAGRSEACG